MPKLSAWGQHVAHWRDCRRCPLWEGRSSVVLARGTVPCDVLFIGEAPGLAEDTLGQPFVGPAGQLLDQIVEQAVPKGVTSAYSNLLACIPLAEDGGKATEPEVADMKACYPRLKEFIAICRPKVVVCVGLLADKWLHSQRADAGLRDVRMVSITHPAAILRGPTVMQGLASQRCIVTIMNAVHEAKLCPH